MKIVASLLCVACCLTGCDWQRYGEFRSQLKQLPQFTRWNGGRDGRTLVFLQPVLSEADLRDLGFRPAASASGWLSISYRYRVAGREPGHDTELTFLLEQGKVKAVVFPPELVNLIGQENIGRLLRIAGGHSSSDTALKSVRKSQVAGLAPKDLAAALGDRKIKVEFIPPTPVDRALTLQMEENPAGDAYNKFTIDLRPWVKQRPQ